MIRYTTPSIPLTVEGVDLTGNDIYVSLEQMKHKLVKTGDDLIVTTDTHGQVTDTIITFVLSQEESALFDFGKSCSIQVNYINNAGVRDATDIATIGVMENLLDEVIEYGQA